MKLRLIEPDGRLQTRRGDVVVCIPVYGGHEQFVSCMRSVLAYTPAEVPILICDDASPDTRSQEFVRSLADADEGSGEVLYLRRQRNFGFPANVNGAFALAGSADVIVLNSDCEVSAGWVEGLRDAAYTDSRVATATALTNNGSLASVPERDPRKRGFPQEWAFDDAAAAVRAKSLRIHPLLPTAIGHCMYIRRSALELVGEFDLAFSPGYGEEVDFSQRCLRSGLSHVLADDVLVLHHGGASFGLDSARDALVDEHERLLAARYPYYHAAVKLVEKDVTSPLARSVSVARRALKGLSLVIDARILVNTMTGTTLHVLELIAALARTGEVQITAVVPDTLRNYAAIALAQLPTVELVSRKEVQALARKRRADLVHRPYQISIDEDLAFLARLGERLVVTNQDLISYHNPSYFTDFEKWEGYRRLTRAGLAVADRVVFFSQHACDDAVAEDLVEPDRASVVHIGVDHALIRAHPQPVPPRGAERLPAEAEAMLCIGTDFRHKNRVFALRLLEQLQRRHGWEGYLLLVGPHVDVGSSLPEEAEKLALQPQLARHVVNFGAVSEAEKAWLYARSRLVLYPTVHEGFGLVPFEATDFGVPCCWARGTSLGEILPDSDAAIIPWDIEQSAERALTLLRDEGAREQNLAGIRAAGSKLTWDSTARRLLELYHATCDAPATPATAHERRHGIMQGNLSEDAMRLMGPGGALPRDLERPLLAIATHPQIATPVFRAIRLGYRTSFRLRRLGRASGEDNGSVD